MVNFNIDNIEHRQHGEARWNEGVKTYLPRKSRLYIWSKGESVISNLNNRFSRPVDLYRSYLSNIYEAAGIPADTSAKWSQTAGCACGCSPAFTLDLRDGNDYHVEVVL